MLNMYNNTYNDATLNMYNNKYNATLLTCITMNNIFKIMLL